MSQTIEAHSAGDSNNQRLFCINFTRWKQNYIRAFLGSDGEVLFISSVTQAIKKGIRADSRLVSWASKDQSEVNKLVAQFNCSVWLVEDGFIRSTGLGTDLTAPASLVLDKQGIYYDPSRPSDLEMLLQNKDFNEKELKRAHDLKDALLSNELSKYNLGGKLNKTSLKAKLHQKIILIPGQVEDDASIRKGCVDVKTNAALIKAVRKNHPGDYLIYKPHPDVVSGNRKGKVDKAVLRLCDQVVYDASITDCLALANEVHTMTSLVGFEGLMRGLKVVCYGLPFYSNWGLTEDRHTLERRARSLSLEQLVAATLIDYPRYIDWRTGEFTTPEVIVEQLARQIEQQGGKQTNQVFWLSRKLRKLRNIVSGILLFR